MTHEHEVQHNFFEHANFNESSKKSKHVPVLKLYYQYEKLKDVIAGHSNPGYIFIKNAGARVIIIFVT